jgi:hypothetical protein
MIPRFFTENEVDRIRFVRFVQKNRDTIKNALDKKEEKLEAAGNIAGMAFIPSLDSSTPFFLIIIR